MTHTSRIFLLLAVFLILNPIHADQGTLNMKKESSVSRIDLYNPAWLEAHRPFLIAHRGGVITEDTPECSLGAIRLAQEHGYSMVELDIRETKDHVPVIFHDSNLKKSCGINKTISDLTSTEVVSIRMFKTDREIESEEQIPTFDQAASLCAELNLGIMMDIKDKGGSEEFFRRIAGIIKKYDLARCTICISRIPLSESIWGDSVMFRLLDEEWNNLAEAGPNSFLHRFWFSVPRDITDESITALRERGAMVIPAFIRSISFPASHLEEAGKDIERMKAIGVDAFQIDSVYEVYFE